MDTIKCLKTRRSVRFYKPDPIPAKILRQILETASYAPSSKNSQPWEYFLLTGKEKDTLCNLIVKEQLAREKLSVAKGVIIPQNFNDLGSVTFIRQAPVLILVFNKAPYSKGEENVIKKMSEMGKRALTVYSSEIQSIAAFVFSLLLAAHSLGLGGCWIADINFCRDKIKKYLGTENDLVASVVLGYPQEKVSPKRINLDSDAVKFWREG